MDTRYKILSTMDTRQYSEFRHKNIMYHGYQTWKGELWIPDVTHKIQLMFHDNGT